MMVVRIRRPRGLHYGMSRQFTSSGFLNSRTDRLVGTAQATLTQPLYNGGKTPANTLSAAIRREIHTKGKDTRFTLAERGKFARS